MISAAADMLDPALYANVLKPPLEAESLPAWCYTDPLSYTHLTLPTTPYV